MPDSCPKCGSAILENEQVCITCGERLWLSNRFEPATIFYSYSHKDQDLRDKLEAHLAALRRSGLIREWHDRKVTPGQDWDKEISVHLESAQIILLLLSADFLSSSYISNIEVRRALQRQRDGAAVVVPVILRPVLWDIVPEFRRLEALPQGAVPVTEWSSHDSAFVSICEGILRVVLFRSSAASLSQKAGVPDSHFHGLKPAARRRRRTLDAALPALVPIAKPSTLLVMVRRTDAPGLRAIIKADPGLGMNERDIDSQTVMLEFPTDKSGMPKALEVRVKIDSPQFQPTSQVKRIVIPPRGDSEARVFLLTPVQTGPLVLNLEVLRDDKILAGCILRSVGVQSEDELPPRQSVASAWLPVSSDDDGTEGSGPKQSHSSQDESSRTSANGKGEFTGFFSKPFSDGKQTSTQGIPVDPGLRQQTPGDFTRVFGQAENRGSEGGLLKESSESADVAGATMVFSPSRDEPPTTQPAVPSGPSSCTVFHHSEPQSQRIANAGAAADAAGVAPPPVPAWQPPTPPQIPYSTPQPPVPPTPAMPSPQVPVVPPRPQPETAAPNAVSYWPLIIAFNALFILALLLVLYFALWH